MFWNSPKEVLVKGYVKFEEKYICIICQEEFEIGRIYEIDGKLYDAKKAVEMHILESHESMLSYILNMNTSYTGISEVQRKVMSLMAEGLTDKEIALNLGVADSTIRSHRYKLREKEKQAKLFLAMTELLSLKTSSEMHKFDKNILVDAHNSAKMIDERYNITEKETVNIIETYFDENGVLKNFPSKEKRKIIILREIMKNFSQGKEYREVELNRILKRIYEDNATIRRALIEYGFLERKKDGSVYWVKE